MLAYKEHLLANFIPRGQVSKEGLDEMEMLSSSNLCKHIVSFTYIVPEMVKPGEDPSLRNIALKLIPDQRY
jgi:hypothetical protein